MGIRNMIKQTLPKLTEKLEEKFKELSQNTEHGRKYLENEIENKRQERPFHKVNIHLLGVPSPTPVLLPGKSHGWRSPAGYSPWGQKESDMTERLHFFTFKYVYCDISC